MLDKLNISQRKLLNWLGFVVVVGVGFMLIQPADHPISPEFSTPLKPTASCSSSADWRSFGSYEERIERELTATLSQIVGVGSVKVFTTLERGPSIVVAQSITDDTRTIEETDRSSGVRTTQDNRYTASPVTLRLDGEKKEVPLIIEEHDPSIRGVLIVASGAQDPAIRYQIARAVQTVLQIPLYKIEVLPKENGG